MLCRERQCIDPVLILLPILLRPRPWLRYTFPMPSGFACLFLVVHCVCEPEFGCDVRFDEDLEDVRNRSANEHFCLCDHSDLRLPVEQQLKIMVDTHQEKTGKCWIRWSN